MGNRGRPRSPIQPHIVYIKLRLRPGRDDDLVAFFESIPPGLRAAMVKEALRSGVMIPDQEGTREQDQLLDALDYFVEG